MHTMQCATDSNFVPSFCTLQSSLDTEPSPSLDTEVLPSLYENRSESKGATYKQKPRAVN